MLDQKEAGIQTTPLLKKPSAANSNGVYTLNSLFRKKDPRDIGYRWEYDGEAVPFLRRCLGITDLLSYGINSSFGAGIFVLAGTVAATTAGPAVILSFLLAGISSIISAFCYSEFSARLPVSGSAYAYVYVAFGELMGWITGWIITLEYLFCAAAVAQGTVGAWGSTAQMMGISVPKQFFELEITTDVYFFPFAAFLCIVCTSALLIGVKDSARFWKGITVLNVGILVFLTVVGCAYIKVSNWHDFMPFGIAGVFTGASKVFFAYIGFDTTTVLAGEVKEPVKLMPRGVIGTLVVSMTFYLVTSLVITGMVPYAELAGAHFPLAHAFLLNRAKWAGVVIAIAALFCMMANILASMMGQTRIFYQMAKDGLLGKKFGELNNLRVPHFASVVTSVAAIFLAMFFDFNILGDFINCGTLIVFTFIKIGIIAKRYIDASEPMQPKHIALLIATVVISILNGVAKMYWRWYVSMTLFLCFVGCVGLMYIYKPGPNRNPEHAKEFMCPWVPLLPCVGIWLDMGMVTSLGWQPFVEVVVWAALGIGIYLLYGIRHSRLNFLKPTEEYYY